VKRLACIATLTLLALAAPPANAQQPAKSVVATGVGSAPVEPENRNNNASILDAIEAANQAALPEAFEEAREHAGELAKLSGLTLGGVVEISDSSQQSPPFYGPFGGASPYFGPFGLNKFCGTIRRPRFRTVNGERRRVGTRQARVCRFPDEIAVTLTVTFAAT
jgi:uncharacterized protein YggE